MSISFVSEYNICISYKSDLHKLSLSKLPQKMGFIFLINSFSPNSQRYSDINDSKKKKHICEEITLLYTERQNVESYSKTKTK